ncbi:GatB YqeY domain-containing protein [Suillus clintonianus]|uniref:GatB YqeY domain-containing protein n=1 Tax=Suillus clintonianus TaxID=1904413 RepID=UPI001B87F1E7|nr:GatB YqeY domain-containing protein [Suillus clintonianus]KAG2153892.1 GatB YqeY domain-containing protein [Suillus clintonianus]
MILALPLRSLRQPLCKMLIMSRALSVATLGVSDIRQQLMSGVKTAMKAKDSMTSMTLRTILSEVYAADKLAGSPVSSPAIIAILRRATLRRHDSANQFVKASRPDLAQKEQREADIIAPFLPPLMSEADIDRVLNEVIAETTLDGDSRKILGQVYKTFYSKVDKSNVDTETVKRKAEALLLNV